MSGEPLRVLLVEDNPGDARLVEHHVREGSVFDVADAVAVTHVETLDAASEAFEDDEYDILLLDLGLPESTGLDTLERVEPDELEVPIVVLTGLDDHATAIEAIQQGAQDYLPKDELDTDRLMRSLRYAVERKKQQLELKRRTNQLEFFNSVLRHDVQNGMDVVRQNAAILTDRLEGDEHDRATTIQNWSEDMIDLTQKVRGMLDSLTDGERDRTPMDVVEVLEGEIETVAGMEGVTVEADLPDRAAVMADEMLSAVLGNVLTNAVEHNDREEATVEVTVTEEAGTVHVRVADDGPGIPAELKEAVFGKGVQASDGGGGFGLYFVATMVDGYGGSVTVGDNDPRGTVFDIALPTPLGGGGDQPA
jgi:signal transduction histidine kinase